MQQIMIKFLNMFRTSLLPSSGEQNCVSLPMGFCPGCTCCGSGGSGSEMCALWRECCLQHFVNVALVFVTIMVTVTRWHKWFGKTLKIERWCRATSMTCPRHSYVMHFHPIHFSIMNLRNFKDGEAITVVVCSCFPGPHTMGLSKAGLRFDISCLKVFDFLRMNTCTIHSADLLNKLPS